MSVAGYTASVRELMEQMSKLPGIGPRSAERIVFHLLKASPEQALGLADAIRRVKTEVRHCKICYNLCEGPQCQICSDPRRDAGKVLVVEQPKDLMQLEGASVHDGLYHVLLGHIAPLEGIGPEDLTISALLDRVAAGDVREVIIGTNPTMEGDGTALHIRSLLAAKGVKVTQLARGLPAGSQLEYASRSILADAIAGRQEMK